MAAACQLRTWEYRIYRLHVCDRHAQVPEKRYSRPTFRPYGDRLDIQRLPHQCPGFVAKVADSSDVVTQKIKYSHEWQHSLQGPLCACFSVNELQNDHQLVTTTRGRQEMMVGQMLGRGLET